MSYTTYLFDFDYTLADSSRGIVTCFRNVLTRHGYMEVTDEEIKRTIGKTLEDSFSILTGVTDAQQLAGFKDEYRKEADTHMTVNTVLFLETKSVLVALKDAGAHIGIISTKYRYRIKELLDQHSLSSFLDIIVGGEDVKTPKPSPEGLLFAIKQLHTTKAETLYIGDSTIDAETAQAAGVDFAGVTHGVTTAEELSKYPHKKIMSTLEELLEKDKKEERQVAKEKIQQPVALQPDEFITSPSPLPKKKRKKISIWQIVLLAFLLWLSYEEQQEDASYFFPSIFILSFWGILQKRKLLPDRFKTFISPWWNPCEVRLRACHIKLIRGKETPANNNKATTCLNCGTTYTGNFCNRCGQSRNTPRYRLSNALKNIVGGFTNIDNGFGRTLIDLLHRPGYMIRDFIAGKRIPYFRPFQTLFILAALYIMCVQIVDPDALNREEKHQTTNKQELIATRDSLQKSMELTEDQVSKKVFARIIKNLDKQIEKSDRANKQNTRFLQVDNNKEDEDILQIASSAKDKLKTHISKSPFLMKVWHLMESWTHGNKAFRIIATLPLFALATLLAFRRKKKYKSNYNLTEHIFIQAYIACQILLISIIVLPFNGKARVDEIYEVSLWFILFLFCWDYKQLFQCTWWKSFWRTILMLIYSLLLLILFAIVVTFLVITVFYLLKPVL